MRMYVLLIFTAIFLSFSTAYYAFNLQKKTTADVLDLETIALYKKEFEKNHGPFLEIDLSAMYPSRRYSELLQPQNVFAREANSAKTYFSKSCNGIQEKMSKALYDKSETWEDFRCNRILRLPVKFFENAPLMHESGVSYAFLAFLSGRPPFFNIEWVRSNLNLFHVSELEELPLSSLEANFRILSKLRKYDLEEVVKGTNYIISDHYFMVRNRRDFNVTYKIFDKAKLDDFLQEKFYNLRPYQEGEQCFYHEGRFCWEKDTRSLVQVFMQSSIIVFSGSLVVLLLIAVILFKKIKNQKFEEERKKHALRVLTHELRTPIANLMLQVESINKQSDLLPASVLEDFLKVEGEVYRLKRLAEKSTSYLQTNDGKSLLAISPQEVPSVNALVEDILHDYIVKGVVFTPLLKDEPAKLDVYWFGICIKNLVENALFHGEAPVNVSLNSLHDALELTVVDYGTCPYKNLDEITRSDRKNKNSSGLGLGVSIVQKIMKEMGGKLLYTQTPTTFTLFLRNKK